jgi:hypothetical protein
MAALTHASLSRNERKDKHRAIREKYGVWVASPSGTMMCDELMFAV